MSPSHHPLAGSRPRIIPVMDVRGGIVVRAIAGRREEYRPLVSRLTDSTDPLAVAEALRAHVGTDELYLADLDAIQGGKPDLELFAELVQRGFRLWIDAGLRSAMDGQAIADVGAHVVIGGMETLFDAGELGRLGSMLTHRSAFSLDLRNGVPVRDPATWSETIECTLNLAAVFDVRRLIILDLSHVGTSSGTGTEDWCAWAKAEHPYLELIAGGGIRGPEDLPRLQAAGVSAVLVASALHDGRFGLPAAPM